mgnify:FL=1
MEILNLNLTREFMRNGNDTISYMQQMIQDLELIANQPQHYGKEVAHKLENLSYEMYRNVSELQSLIYMYGDI